jgi:hypothetical protein
MAISFNREKADAPAGLELERPVSEREGTAFLNISVDTLKRLADRRRIRRIAISARRRAYRLRDLLALADASVA